MMAPRTPTDYLEVKISSMSWLKWSKRHWAYEARIAKRRADRILLSRGYLPPAQARILGHWMAATFYGWTGEQWNCLDRLWGTKDGQTLESGWDVLADNPTSPALGVAQTDPWTKLRTAVPVSWLVANPHFKWWQSAYVQIKWGLKYIRTNGNFSSPCEALNYRLDNHSY